MNITCPKCKNTLNITKEQVIEDGVLCEKCNTYFYSFKSLRNPDIIKKISNNLKRYMLVLFLHTLFPEFFEIEYVTQNNTKKHISDLIKFKHMIWAANNNIYSIDDWPKCQYCGIRPIIPDEKIPHKTWCPNHECKTKLSNPMILDPQGTLEKIQKTMKAKYGVTNINELERIREIKRQKQLKKWEDIRYRIRRANNIFEKHGVYNVKQNKELIQELITEAELSDSNYESFMKFVYDVYNAFNEIALIEPSNFKEFLLKQGDENRSYTFKCKRCGLVFKRYSSPIHDALFWLRTKNCPILCPKCDVSKSKYESEIVGYLMKNVDMDYIEIKRNDHKLLHPHEIDIVIQSQTNPYSVGIEYDSIFYHSTQHLRVFSSSFSEFQQKVLKYKKKLENKYTKAYYHDNLQLFIIDEVSWTDNKDFWLSKLKLALGDTKNVDRIYARDTYVDILDSDTANQFVAKYHIHGIRPGTYYLGIFHANELLGVMVIGKTSSRKIMDDRPNIEYELYRLTFKPYVHVIGGFSKLLKFMSKKLNIKSIQTYVDLALGFKPNMWSNIGFKFVAFNPTTYKIIDNQTGELKHRIYIRKLLERGQSELEFVWENPRYDIWYRPGTVKLIYNS